MTIATVVAVVVVMVNAAVVTASTNTYTHTRTSTMNKRKMTNEKNERNKRAGFSSRKCAKKGKSKLS